MAMYKKKTTKRKGPAPSGRMITRGRGMYQNTRGMNPTKKKR